ncbi:MAG TPA: enolase C-terminal domain-like protein [Cytophagaceae bacterium]|jgi:L-alanine-DL-glutamate epimerase-like enolase superfamily enzyme|nr:enolase C-terminal domain-like protein [Cytophagaceae bacterium]
MVTWEIADLRLNLLYEWKIARNTSSSKHNLLIRIQQGEHNGLGEVAPNVRYGETPELLHKQFSEITPVLLRNSTLSPIDFASFIKKLPIANALKNGIETAYIHMHCQTMKLSVPQLLGIPQPDEQVYTSYTLPIMPVEQINSFITAHRLQRFKSLKIKVNKETAIDMVKETLLHYEGPVRIDGNETWTEESEVLYFMEAISSDRIEFMEQPLPERCVNEYKKLKKISPIPIILDESITDNPNFDLLSELCHGINMKMMKAGGYYNSLAILQGAQKYDLQTMIGCMIETTLGIFSAINLSNRINYLDLDGFFVIEDDPFTLVKEENGGLIVNKEIF